MMDILIIIAVILGVIVILIGFVIYRFARFINKNMFSWHPKYSSDLYKTEEHAD